MQAGRSKDVTWHELPAGRVRAWRHRPAGSVPDRHVVVLPGLALPSYLFPFARDLAGRGVEVTVLDTLAFRGGRRVEASITGLAAAAAQWIASAGAPGTVLVGHSSGAQSAAEVALDPTASALVAAVVLAGPTFAPRQRSLPRLALATCTAYRRDSPRELVVARDALAVRTDVVRLIRSGLAHRLEDRLPLVTVPTTVTAGASDSYGPREWLDLLAARAGGPARVVVLPGSHNNVFPYAARFASLVEEAVRAA